jgi:hypothetical protein
MKFDFKTFNEKYELKNWITENQELISKVVSITIEKFSLRTEYTVWYWGNI